MSMNLLLLFVTSIIALINGNIDQGKNHQLKWSEQHRLTWEDFQGNGRVRDPHSANTYSGFVFKWEENDEVLIFEHYSYFDSRKSWVKKDKKTDRLLNHEQGHFDITEIFSRRLKQRVSEERINSRNASKKFRRISDDVVEQWDDFQSKYDQETDFGMDHEAQAKWNEKIATELKSLNQFAEDEIKLDI